jgi:hypothetical protein
MKTKHGIFFGFAVMLAAAIFTLAGCDNTGGGGSGGGGSGSTPETYTSSGTDGSRYELTITSPAVKAAIGDKYVLIIIKKGQSRTSTGKIQSVVGIEFTLKPEGSNETFKAKADKSGLTGITGNIILDDGKEEPAPGEVKPVKPVPSGNGNSGENGNTNGTQQAKAPEIENTVFIGSATKGPYTGEYFYIGNTGTSSDTPSYIYSLPGWYLHIGSDWDNTPEWKPAIEYMLENYKIQKNGVPVVYSDLPDYNGNGTRNNRMQHFIFSLGLTKEQVQDYGNDTETNDPESNIPESNDPETQKNFFGITPDNYTAQNFSGGILYHWTWNSVNKIDELGAILVQKGYHLTSTSPQETGGMLWHGTRVEMNSIDSPRYYSVEYFDGQGNCWWKNYSNDSESNIPEPNVPDPNAPETQEDFFGIIPDFYFTPEDCSDEPKYYCWGWDSVNKTDELVAILVQKGYHLTETRLHQDTGVFWHGTRVELYEHDYAVGYSEGQGNYLWKWYSK